MDLSRATASAICKSSSRLAATVLAISVSSLGPFSGLQIFVDELVGENEFRVGDGAKRKFDVAVVGADHDIGTVQPQQDAAKPLAPFVRVAVANAFDGKREFDLGLVAGPAREIHRPGQRPVDPGRG